MTLVENEVFLPTFFHPQPNLVLNISTPAASFHLSSIIDMKAPATSHTHKKIRAALNEKHQSMLTQRRKVVGVLILRIFPITVEFSNDSWKRAFICHFFTSLTNLAHVRIPAACLHLDIKSIHLRTSAIPISQ